MKMPMGEQIRGTVLSRADKAVRFYSPIRLTLRISFHLDIFFLSSSSFYFPSRRNGNWVTGRKYRCSIISSVKRLRVSEPLCTRPKALSATFAETRPSLTESSRLVFVVSRSRPKIADSRVHLAARKYSPLQLIGPIVPFSLARYRNGSRKYFDALANFLLLYQLREIL